MKTRLLFTLIAFCFCAGVHAPSMFAGFYLTGVQIYAASADGSVDTQYFDYRFTTNQNDIGNNQLVVTSTNPSVRNMNPPELPKAVSFGLPQGDTVFAFNGNNFNLPGDHLGLNLFFTDTDGRADNSYNPSDVGIKTGDISAFASASGFQVVPQGKVVQNYKFTGYSSASSQKPLSEGSLSFGLGDYTVSLTGFSLTSASGQPPAGTFKLTVTATPEPSTIGFGALAFCGIAHWVKKRRKKKAA